MTSMLHSLVTAQGSNMNSNVVVRGDTHKAGSGMIPGPALRVVLVVRAGYGVSVQVAME